MAVTATNLVASGSGTDGTSFTTASISPTANRLVLVTIYSADVSSPAATPTVSGAGMTWVQVDTVVSTNFRTTVFRSMSASPGSGALTIDFGAATQDLCIWCIDEFGNVDTSGANGAGAVVQSANNSATGATSLAITLSAFASTNNATFGGFGIGASTSSTVGSGFTQLGDFGVGTGHATSEWKNSNDTSVDLSWADSATGVGVAVEIREGGGAGKSYAFFM